MVEEQSRKAGPWSREHVLNVADPAIPNVRGEEEAVLILLLAAVIVVRAGKR
jgi:hypothetical protein